LELRQKLVLRGYDSPEVDQVIERLVSEGLQSDERFAESLVRQRHEQGHGPARIRQELLTKGVEESLVSRWLKACPDDWLEKGRSVRIKRFGEALPESAAERARQMRFLQYRGFTHEQIRAILRPE
jgi:regulatory protein